MKDNETCCGFGGTFSVKYEGIAVGMAEQKILNAEVNKGRISHFDGLILPYAHAGIHAKNWKEVKDDAPCRCSCQWVVILSIVLYRLSAFFNENEKK